MSAKKQSAITSFFTRTPKAENLEKNENENPKKPAENTPQKKRVEENLKKNNGEDLVEIIEKLPERKRQMEVINLTSPERKRRKEETEVIVESFSDVSLTTGWFNVPEKFRKIIIDMMDSKTRCLFAICSKKCEEEAKASKNYLFKIRADGETMAERKLHVGHSVVNGSSDFDYTLEFHLIRKGKTKKNPNPAHSTKIVYKKERNGKTMWEKIEEGIPSDVRVKYLKKLVGGARKSLKVIEIEDKIGSCYLADVKNCPNLEKVFVSNGDVIHEDFMTIKQIKSIKEVKIRETPLNFQDFLEFKGERISFLSPRFNEKRLNDYLKKLKKGEVHRNANYITINFKLRRTELSPKDVKEGIKTYDSRPKRYEYNFKSYLDYERNDEKHFMEVCMNRRNVFISIFSVKELE